MRKIHKVLAQGLEVEFLVSDDLAREYRECISDEAGERYCFTCGWDNAHIGKVSACSIPEMRYLLDERSENMTGWRAQIMKEFCKKM